MSFHPEAGQSPQERKAMRVYEKVTPTEEIVKHNVRLAQEYAQDHDNAKAVARMLQERVIDKIAAASTWSEKQEIAEGWLESTMNRHQMPDHVVEGEEPYFLVALAQELQKSEYNQ